MTKIISKILRKFEEWMVICIACMIALFFYVLCNPFAWIGMLCAGFLIKSCRG